MHWILYLALASAPNHFYAYHENNVVKYFDTKAACEQTLKLEKKDVASTNAVVYGKDFTLVCKLGRGNK